MDAPLADTRLAEYMSAVQLERVDVLIEADGAGSLAGLHQLVAGGAVAKGLAGRQRQRRCGGCETGRRRTKPRNARIMRNSDGAVWICVQSERGRYVANVHSFGARRRRRTAQGAVGKCAVVEKVGVGTLVAA